MPVPASINDLSIVPGSNSPAGSESPGLIDDYLRTQAAFIAQLRDTRATLSQVAGLAGTALNLAMLINTASSSATLTADEVIVESALGGTRYCLPSFNKTVNLATTGAGGMDTGAAPASGFVALYAIYNPTTTVSALLAVNATSVAAPAIYGGANMPSGYTASGLVSVVPTNASSQFSQLSQYDRSVSIPGSTIMSNSIINGSVTTINNLVVPLNANRCSGFLQVSVSGASSAISIIVYSTTSGTGNQNLAAVLSAGTAFAVPFRDVQLTLRQRMLYSSASSAGTPSFAINVSSYGF